MRVLKTVTSRCVLGSNRDRRNLHESCCFSSTPLTNKQAPTYPHLHSSSSGDHNLWLVQTAQRRHSSEWGSMCRAPILLAQGPLLGARCSAGWFACSGAALQQRQDAQEPVYAGLAPAEDSVSM